MRKKRYVVPITIAAFTFVFLIAIFSLAVKADAALDSKGTDFWVVFMQNYSGTPNLQLFITSDVDTSGTVEIPGLGWSQVFTVTADTTTTVNIPSSAMLYFTRS
jgi:hypothetical protein